MIYRFLGLELDEDAFEIRRNGSPVLTQRKAFDFVHFLLRNRDRVVTRDELIDALWGGASRSMSTIPQCAATVRRSLGEDMDPQAVVQTVRGRGYRFVAVIEEVDPAPSDFTAGSLGDAFERIGVSETRLVGRQEVLAALRGALQESLSGETRVVLLTGEPGIGKTRLVEELCREATNEGSMVLTGRCHEVDGAPAFWPWIQTIREWGRLNGEKPIPEELRKEVAFFASWRPEAGPQTADSAAGISEGPEARFQLFDVATRALRKFAEHSPLVLVLEDMHWADPASLGLLRFVAAQLHGERVLVLGTCREDELPYAPELSETLGELARESTFRRLAIKGLGREHVTELLLQIVGKNVPPALTESVVSMTEGNPFFVVELARILDAEESELEVELPVSISAAIGRRLGKLTAESRELLTLASVIGREFSMTLLSKVVGSEHGPILASLEGLVAARIIEPSSGAPDAYRFNHALIRETLYRGILAPSRARFHRLIATALERLYRESAIPPLAELAHHWYLAVETGGVEEAAEYCERAGLLAASRLAFEEAVSLLRRATELADLRPSSNDSVRCELLLQLGHAEWNAAEQSSSRATFARAAVLARQVGSARLFARAAIGYYGFEEGISADSTTLALLEEAANWISPDSPVLRTSVLTKLQHMVPHANSMEMQRSMSLEALALARDCGEIEALREAFRARHNATLGPDSLDEKLEWEKECRSWGKQLDDPWLSWFGNDIASPLARGDRDGVLHAFRQGSRFAEAMPGNRVSRFVGFLQQTGIALMEGRFDDANRFIGELYEQGRACVSWAELAQQSFRFAELWETGKIDRLAQDWMPFLEGMTASFETEAMLGHSAIALVRSFCDDRGAAIVAIDSILGPDFARHERNENWMSAAHFLATAIECHGTGAQAETLSAALEPFAEQIVCQMSARWVGGSVASTRGLLSSVLGDFEAGISQFDEGIAREEALGAKPAVLRSKAGLACLLARRRARGDRHRAQGLMDEVLAGCKSLGIDPRLKYVVPFERLLESRT